MPGTPSTKWSLPTMAGTDVANMIDEYTVSLTGALDSKLAPSDQGALASRPPSTVGSPGKSGRTYLATDVGKLFRDNGTGWDEIALGAGAWSALSIDPALQTPAGSSGYVASSRLERPDTVRLKGVIFNNGSSSFGGIAATLPVGQRPSTGLRFNVNDGSSGAIVVTLASNGWVQAVLPVGRSLCLDGITYTIN